MPWENQGSDVWYRESDYEREKRFERGHSERERKAEEFYEKNKRRVDEQLRRDAIMGKYKQIDDAEKNLTTIAEECPSVSRFDIEEICGKLRASLPDVDWDTSEELIRCWEYDSLPSRMRSKAR